MDQLASMTLFARVVERGSFSEVAKEAGLTQPTISKCISALEKRLGTQLLNRSTRHVRPTETGRDYYAECRRILEAVERAEESVTSRQSRAGGSLKLSVPISFGRLYMVSRVVTFLGQSPELSIELDMNDRAVDIIKEGYDLAIRTGRLRESSLIARKIGRNNRVMIATPKYLAAHGTPRSPADLARHNCIRTADEWMLHGPDGDERVDVTGNLTVNNAEAVREAVLADLGIGIVPLWAVHQEIRDRTVRTLLARYAPAAKDIYAVYPYTRQLASKVRLFIDFIEEDLRRVSYLPAASKGKPAGGLAALDDRRQRALAMGGQGT